MKDAEKKAYEEMEQSEDAVTMAKHRYSIAKYDVGGAIARMQKTIGGIVRQGNEVKL